MDEKIAEEEKKKEGKMDEKVGELNEEEEEEGEIEEEQEKEKEEKVGWGVGGT